MRDEDLDFSHAPDEKSGQALNLNFIEQTPDFMDKY